jgi:hypothetical protein
MRKITIFGVIIALLAFGGTALALMENDNTYTGCLNPGGNIHSVAIGNEPARPCVDDQLQISWNSEGPPGPRGEPGVSKGFATSFGDIDIFPNDEPQPVMELTLPEGDYISTITIHASYYIDGYYPKDEHAYIDCYSEKDDGAPVAGDFGTTLQGQETTSLTFPISLDEDGEVITYCEVGHISEDTQKITINRGNWTAIQVDTLDRQLPLYSESE